MKDEAPKSETAKVEGSKPSGEGKSESAKIETGKGNRQRRDPRAAGRSGSPGHPRAAGFRGGVRGRIQRSGAGAGCRTIRAGAAHDGRRAASSGGPGGTARAADLPIGSRKAGIPAHEVTLTSSRVLL